MKLKDETSMYYFLRNSTFNVVIIKNFDDSPFDKLFF